MLIFLTSHSLWLSGAILVGLTTLVAMLATALVRRCVGLDRLSTNNEVAGFKFATVGVLYAVFLAFAIILVWQKYSEADSTVAKEAGAAATIYHLSHGLGETQGDALRAALTNYLRVVISQEWPAMEQGGASRSARQALEAIYAALLQAKSAEQQDTALTSEIFYQLDVLTQARRARLLAAEGVVPGVVWVVLFGGAVLTIGFTLFFGTPNLRAQTLMTGMLSALIFSELLIVVAIDHPFTGTVKVGPEALTEVLADFGS
jgi:Protein of unknown function (DUF4239)